MSTTSRLLLALALGTLLGACAATGTRVTATSDAGRNMAQSQQWWCGSFKDTCGCSIDDKPTTCSLVATCLNAGSCKQ